MLWPAWASGEKLSFNRTSAPSFSENCFYCHGVDGNKRKADLRLGARADALRSDAFAPGDLNASELIHRIHSTDEDEVMPPPESNRILTSEQKNILERWIKEGAEYEKHWAFVAPAKKALPPVKRTEWVRNPIDRFVLSKLDERNLSPSTEAPKEVLIKRLLLRFDRIAPLASGSGFLPLRPLIRCLRKSRRSPFEKPPLWRENGPRVAGRRPLCRQQRLSIRRGNRPVGLAGLGGQGPQRRHALRPVHHLAIGR